MKFKRLRDAIDSRITEEQARQKTSQDALSRSNSARRPPGRNGSPSRRPARPRRNTATPIRGPDPKEFEAEFALGDDDGPTRSGTPQPAESTGGPEGGAAAEGGNEGETSAPIAEASGKEETPAAAPEANQLPSELPPEIRAKLRRLDKMETRYHGMNGARLGGGSDDELMLIILLFLGQIFSKRTGPRILESCRLNRSKPLCARTLP